MIDFNKLRERKGTNFSAVQATLQKTEQSGFKKDERIWKPQHKDMKSSNIIRFLPVSYADLVAVEEGKFQADDLTPMAKIYSHQFQGPNGWYFENSLQTFGETCPVREMDGPHWKAAKNDKHLKDIMIKRIAKVDYYACVLVIKDSTNPDNNGKVMLYKFGESIKKQLDKAGSPEFEGEVAFDPYDAWEGANLILNLTYEKKVIGQNEAIVPNFDNVKWANPAPMGDDAFIEEIWKKQYSIMEFYDRKNFKTYDELKTKLCKVMNMDENFNPISGKSTEAAQSESLASKIEKTAEAKSLPSTSAPATETTAPSGDDSMDEFERLLAAS